MHAALHALGLDSKLDDMVVPENLSGSKGGSTVPNLIHLAEKYGAKAKFRSGMSYSNLRMATSPVILHTSTPVMESTYFHWVVFLGMDGSLLKIYDPPNGLYTISRLIGLPIAYLLISSAVSHIGNPYAFLSTIHSYELLPRPLAELLAMGLPFCHLTIAVCLVSNKFRNPGFLSGILLFAVYSLAQSIVFFRGLKIDCGCFGSYQESQSIGIKSIGLAVAASLVCLLGWWRACAEVRRPDSPAMRPKATNL